MSKMPRFHYSMTNGKSFFDPGVYTSNRQFRLLLCSKLSYLSQTAISLSQPPALAMLVLSCITHIGGNAGLIPQETIPRLVTGNLPVKSREKKKNAW
jgi:hypothetical protein